MPDKKTRSSYNRKNDGAAIGKKIFHLLPQKQKLFFLLILLILGMSAVLSQLTPLSIGYLTDSVLAGPRRDFWSVLPVLLVILAVNVANEILKVARRLMAENTATQAEKTARRKAADSLLMAPLSYFRSHMTGNIHGRLNRSLEGTVKLIKLMFMDFAPAVTTGMAAIVTIFVQLPVPVAFLVILVIPTSTFLVFRQISTQRGIRTELIETKADMDGTIVELLTGIETIRALNSAQAESDRILDRSEQLRKKEMRHHRSMAFYDCLKFVNEAVFSVLVIGISVLLASRSVISVGTVLTAYLCFTQLTGPLRELHRILDEFSECMVLARDYFQILDLPVDFSYRTQDGQPPDISDRAQNGQPLDPSDQAQNEQPLDTFDRAQNGQPLDPSDRAQDGQSPDISDRARDGAVPASGDVDIRGLYFSYPEKPEQEILSGIDLHIPSGKFIGIAGPSGCGKSTLIKVIDRLEPGAGSVLLGGVPLSSLSRGTLAEHVALVPQTPFIIADTVYHNICYGINREVTEEEVREAARKANIADEIETLPGAYQFPLAEGGTNLSGGQRQRIAIARIFLRKPKILLLDEATSALDNTSEKLIQTEIEKMNRECDTTVISIAHRLSTLRNCDEIIVMEHGRIIQKGTFQTLEHSPGVFHDMVPGILK